MLKKRATYVEKQLNMEVQIGDKFMKRLWIALSLLAFILIAILTVKFGYDFIFGADTIEGVPKGELIYEIKSSNQL